MRMRSVFISDIHLGFKGCSADMLLEFLHQVEMDYLFLVGDIVDLWSMKKTVPCNAAAELSLAIAGARG